MSWFISAQGVLSRYKCHSDYAEHLVAIFANQIWSEYYGVNISVSIEASVL